MINKGIAVSSVEKFNASIETMNKSENFDDAIKNIWETGRCIHQLESVIKQMKQEEHNIIQDVYNRFKEKNYVKTITF